MQHENVLQITIHHVNMFVCLFCITMVFTITILLHQVLSLPGPDGEWHSCATIS